MKQAGQAGPSCPQGARCLALFELGARLPVSCEGAMPDLRALFRAEAEIFAFE